MTDATTTLDSLKAFSDFLMGYAVMLAALGALTVGLMEAYKKVFSTLARFQQEAVWRWLSQEEPNSATGLKPRAVFELGGHYGVKPQQHAAGDDPYSAERAYAQLLHLTTGVGVDSVSPSSDRPFGPLRRNVSQALFELELARMMGQVQEAADAALNLPSRHADWFAFITRGCDAQDVKKWLEMMNNPPKESHDDERARMAENYSRIRLLVRRQLDSFQTITAYRWREWNQFWAWLVGALLMFAALFVQASHAGQAPSLGWMIVASLAGGLLAPIAKDLVDALARVKSGG